MSLSLNNSVVSASAFYDHHRHIDKADFQQALDTGSGRVEAVSAVGELGADEAAGLQPEAGGKDNGFSFFDLLDIINPLQHIPIISSIYREITGDEIKGPARILGGALFGGPVGLVSGVVNAAVDEASGHDVGEHVMIALRGGEDTDVPPPLRPADTAGPVMVADAGAGPETGLGVKTDTDTEFRAGTRPGGALENSIAPTMAEEAARDAVMASSLLHENAKRAEARAGGGGVTTPASPAAQPSGQSRGMPTALHPPLAPGMVVQTMMDNLDAYGDIARSRNADGPSGEDVTPVISRPYYGS